MSELISYGLCASILMLALSDSIKKSLNAKTLKFTLERTIYYFSILIAFITLYFKVDVILLMITDFINNYFTFNVIITDILKIILLMCLFFIIQLSLYFLCKGIFFLLGFNRKINKQSILLFFSSIIGSVKGLIILCIIFLSVITYNNTVGYNVKVNVFNNLNTYTELSKLVENKRIYFSKELVEKILPANNIIIYYNGVRIEEGIMSSEEIDSKAIELTKGCTSDREKARILYSWIGSNLEYDYDKAKIALSNERVEDSGAISAWTTRKGICFDYSCLYVAMARANKLKVRLVTGDGFDGSQYGPHAWNEVYLEDEKKWIPLDTTFYSAGDYFDNYDFYNEHIKDSIAGEW